MPDYDNDAEFAAYGGSSTYAGTNVPFGGGDSSGYTYPGVVTPLPILAMPGISMDDAMGGSVYSGSDKSPGADVSTWDHLLQLANLGVNLYQASRPLAGNTPATPDQTANRSRTTPTSRNTVETNPAVPPAKTNWFLILGAGVILFLVVWLILR